MLNIQTLAFKRAKKPTKAQAQDYLESIYKTADDDAVKYKLAALYKYFQPIPPKKCVNILDWVSKAKGKEQDRYYLTEIFADENYIVATDGNRLHATPNTQGYDGYIDTKGNKIELDGTYPEYTRIIPKKTHKDTLNVDNCIVERIGKNTIGRFPLFNTHACFNMKHVYDIMNGRKKATVYTEDMTLKIYKGVAYFGDPLRFEFDDDSIAVLIPTRL